MFPTSPPHSATHQRRRIGIYGGTFDPVHVGHLIIASEVRTALALDEVIFIPAGIPPHKDPAQISAAEDRLAMLRLAVADNDAFTIDTIELEREGRSFTADTLAAIHRREPEADLWFILGADSLAALQTWRDPATIVRLARIAVAARPGWELDLEAVSRLVPESGGRIDTVPAPLVEIASHEIRDRIRAGHPIRYLVPGQVEQFIVSRRLYLDPV